VTSADRLTLERPVALGLRANWRQFWLLVAVNAFVGAMVGLERTVLPLIAEREFGIVSRSAALSFIATFRRGESAHEPPRRPPRWTAMAEEHCWWPAGYSVLPVPLLVIWAPSWSWIIAANVLLGVNQGLAWSTTVVMKIDLVGPERRGLAMGLNEFAGYLALALAALGSGLIAERVGLRPEPFLPRDRLRRYRPWALGPFRTRNGGSRATRGPWHRTSHRWRSARTEANALGTHEARGLARPARSSARVRRVS
jgi:MFS family permease